jgi:nitroreductase
VETNSESSTTATTNQVADVIRNRRTIHNFRPEQPPRQLILDAVELARWAPNHRHTEPWKFHHLGVQSKTKVVELNARLVAEKKGPEAGEAKRLRWNEIPGWLAVTCQRSGETVQDREDYAATCCAIQNLSLYLWTQQVGVKWTSGAVIRHAEYFEILGLDEAEHRSVGLLWYGYAENIPSQQRKPVADILAELD